MKTITFSTPQEATSFRENMKGWGKLVPPLTQGAHPNEVVVNGPISPALEESIRRWKGRIAMNKILELALIATELEKAGFPGLAKRVDSIGEGALTPPQAEVELATVATDAELAGKPELAQRIDAMITAGFGLMYQIPGKGWKTKEFSSEAEREKFVDKLVEKEPDVEVRFEAPRP